MGLWLVLAVIVILAIVALVLGYPLLRRDLPVNESRFERITELELRKESIYSEIRDAEADLRTQKLSEDDYRELDSSLRREAIEILNQIDSISKEGEATG